MRFSPANVWPIALFVGALVAGFWRVPSAERPAFVPQSPGTPAAERAAEPVPPGTVFLPRQGAVAAAPTLALLPDGRVAAAWVGGSAVGSEDAAIWLAFWGRSGWSEPQSVVTRESAAAGLLAHVRHVHGPLLHAEGGWLHLWFSAAGPLGRYGRTLAHQVSTDGGKTWSKPVRLAASPLAYFNTEVRAAPVAMADGGLGLPLSHDGFSQHGEWLRLSPTGILLDKTRIAVAGPALQPVVQVDDAQRATAYLRNATAGTDLSRIAKTDNGGQYWAEANEKGPPGRDGGFARLRLRTGEWLQVGNRDASAQRLDLWLGDSAGERWRLRETLENAVDGGADFRDPAVVQATDGTVHLVYGWRGQTLRHWRFSESWLRATAP